MSLCTNQRDLSFLFGVLLPHWIQITRVIRGKLEDND